MKCTSTLLLTSDSPNIHHCSNRRAMPHTPLAVLSSKTSKPLMKTAQEEFGHLYCRFRIIRGEGGAIWKSQKNGANPRNPSSSRVMFLFFLSYFIWLPSLKAKEKWHLKFWWLEHEPFLLGPGHIFRWYVSFREGTCFWFELIFEPFSYQSGLCLSRVASVVGVFLYTELCPNPLVTWWGAIWIYHVP